MCQVESGAWEEAFGQIGASTKTQIPVIIKTQWTFML